MLELNYPRSIFFSRAYSHPDLAEKWKESTDWMINLKIHRGQRLTREIIVFNWKGKREEEKNKAKRGWLVLGKVISPRNILPCLHSSRMMMKIPRRKSVIQGETFSRVDKFSFFSLSSISLRWRGELVCYRATNTLQSSLRNSSILLFRLVGKW